MNPVSKDSMKLLAERVWVIAHHFESSPPPSGELTARYCVVFHSPGRLLLVPIQSIWGSHQNNGAVVVLRRLFLSWLLRRKPSVILCTPYHGGGAGESWTSFKLAGCVIRIDSKD